MLVDSSCRSEVFSILIEMLGVYPKGGEEVLRELKGATVNCVRLSSSYVSNQLENNWRVHKAKCSAAIPRAMGEQFKRFEAFG